MDMDQQDCTGHRNGPRQNDRGTKIIQWTKDRLFNRQWKEGNTTDK